MEMSEQIDFSQLRISRLEEGETVESFDCGDADLAAITFYEKNYFYPLQPNDDDTHTRLLYFDLRDYKDAFLS